MKPEIFLFDDAPVRVALIDGDPWFVAADAGRILEIAQVASTLRTFPEDEKGVHSMHTLGGPQEIRLVCIVCIRTPDDHFIGQTIRTRPEAILCDRF